VRTRAVYTAAVCSTELRSGYFSFPSSVRRDLRRMHQHLWDHNWLSLSYYELYSRSTDAASQVIRPASVRSGRLSAAELCSASVWARAGLLLASTGSLYAAPDNQV
jgi:hypothetical protein